MDIDNIVLRVKNDDVILVKKAYDFANNKLFLINNNDYNLLKDNILGFIDMLINLGADSLTLISGILGIAINYGGSAEEIEKEFGTVVSNIVLGLNKINKFELICENESGELYLSQLNPNSSIDSRILFIKACLRLCSLQKMDDYSLEYREKLIRETIDVLVPMTDKFRFNIIKSRLEDLCLYYLNPDMYNYILKMMGSSPVLLNESLDNMKEKISNLLNENNINFIIKNRVKSIYSIYNKLASGRSWDDIYDILALRILVEDEEDCGKILDLIHSKYISLPFRVKDYIKSPKKNKYQSLHTTIIGDDDRYYEIQIRTYEMNEIAEIGDAAHFKYKLKKIKRL